MYLVFLLFRFAPLSSVYLRRADAIALVYDVTSLESFRSISKWFDIVKVSAESQ